MDSEGLISPVRRRRASSSMFAAVAAGDDDASGGDDNSIIGDKVIKGFLHLGVSSESFTLGDFTSDFLSELIRGGGAGLGGLSASLRTGLASLKVTMDELPRESCRLYEEGGVANISPTTLA